MAITTINVGTSANDNTGDTLRNAFIKTNGNFETLSTTEKLTNGDLRINSVVVGKGGGGVISNVALGVNALPTNTTGNNNTATGYGALYLNTQGFGNTANGKDALLNNTLGLNNTANGLAALYLNTDGDENVAIGSGSLYNNTSGNGNTVIGTNSLTANTTGNANTAVGSYTFTTGTNYSNSSAIGYDAQANASNQINLGNTAISSLRCNVTSITSLSDERDKTDILEITEGLDFISKLKPVTFTWNQRDGNRVGVKSSGFIAQDLLELQDESLIGENLDLVSENDPERLEARYANLLPVMIKAIQELTERINVLEGN